MLLSSCEFQINFKVSTKLHGIVNQHDVIAFAADYHAAVFGCNAACERSVITDENMRALLYFGAEGHILGLAACKLHKL